MKRREMVGRRFGLWEVIAVSEQPLRVAARCACGTVKDINASNLLRGQSTSCGCNKSTAVSLAVRSHGLSGTPTHKAWKSMRKRCSAKSGVWHERYVARGIKVCERWSSFEAFLADMGERPTPAHTLDRKNNDGDYEPGNCRWAVQREQANNRSSNLSLTHNGETRTLAEWSALTGIRSGVIRQRIYRNGWSIADALTVPPVVGANTH
jgi:hypothetical protein